MVAPFEVDACLLFRATPSRLSTPSPAINEPTQRFPRVAVIRAGSPVPPNRIWSNSRRVPRRGTRHGSHIGGKFSGIKKFTVGEPRLEPIDQNAQVGFKKLKLALTNIQELVKKRGTGGPISLVCDGKLLRVYQRENAGSDLPEYALALFKS